MAHVQPRLTLIFQVHAVFLWLATGNMAYKMLTDGSEPPGSIGKVVKLMMLSMKLRLIFPNHFGIHAALSRMSSEHEILTRIRRSEVVEDSVWMRLEMRGKPDKVENAIEHLGEIGVDVAPIEGDIVH